VAIEFFTALARRAAGGHAIAGCRLRKRSPIFDRLECRQLLAASVVSAVEQYGVPSVFAIDKSANVSYDFLTESGGQVVWNGWTSIPGGSGATAISTGTILVTSSSTLEPYVFMISSNNVYYNYINGSGAWNGWSPAGVGVGARAISSGVIPIANEPYVFMINGVNDVFYNYQLSNGQWAGWSVVGANVGALSVSTGIVLASVAPAIFEPYVFMINGLNDVYYKVRSTTGAWSGWSPVGIGVGAASISAVTLHNQPLVSMQNGAGGIFVNGLNTNGKWLGWSPVGGAGNPGPAVASAAVLANSGINEFALTGAGRVYSTNGIYAHWNAWLGLGPLPSGVAATSISVTSESGRAPFAFAVGTDGNVYWNGQPSFVTWGTWASLGAPI
jgi:hypothetical protein